MKLRDLLPEQHIVVPLPGTSFREGLTALGAALGESGAVRDPQTLQRLIAETRLRDVVLVGKDVALPHYRTTAAARLVVGLGISPTPLTAAGGGLEATPRIVVLVVAPPDAGTLYLRVVAAIARAFRDDQVVTRIAAARSPADVYAVDRLADAAVHPSLTVRDAMNPPTWTLAPETPLREAVDLMVRNRENAVPVVGLKGEVLGMVTDRELMRALLPQIPSGGATAGEGAARPQRVRDIMLRSVLCIPVDLGLEEAATMMVNKDVQHLPVVQEGKLAGVLARGDIIPKLFGR